MAGFNEDTFVAGEMTAEEAIALVQKRPGMFGLQEITAVPDAATEAKMIDLDELIAETRGVVKESTQGTQVLGSPIVRGGILADEAASALESVRAERDAATAALARVRAVVEQWSPAESYGRDEVLAALGGAPEPEGVWEYGYELIEPDDRNVFEREGDFISAAFAYRAAKKRIHEERHPDVPNLQYAIVRRRKAGAWEAVGGESKS